jgi:hypothetical protein
MALIDKFTKDELEYIVKNSLTMKEVLKTIGYSTVSGDNHKTVKNRLEKYNINTDHFTYPLDKVKRNAENIFIENSTASQKTLRLHYKKGNYSPYVCSVCNLPPFWQGKNLTLILDHINGKNHDNRLENLRWVCPNCDMQLDTTGFKGKKYN